MSTDSEGETAIPASDVDALRAALAMAERRATTLAELAALMNEGRDPLALAQRAVELTARATRAAGAFVYLWDAEEERLVLRVATTDWADRRHIGQLKLRVGEGVTGWSALMRQTVVLPRDPQLDPRFKGFAELRESSYRCMLAVPIVSPGEEVLGVFSLYAQQPDAFSDTDVSLATEVGTLLASGLVQAETLSQLKVQSAAAQLLRDLPDEAWASLDGCLDAMAERCAEDLESDVCIVEMTAAPGNPRRGSSAVALSPSFRERYDDQLDGRDRTRTVIADFIAGTDLHRLRIPLEAAAPIGAVTCYRSRRFTPSDERLLEGIGAQIASAALSLRAAEGIRPVLDQLLDATDEHATDQVLRRHGWRPRRAWPTILHIHATGTGDLRTPNAERLEAAVRTAFAGLGDEPLVLGNCGRFIVLTTAPTADARDRALNRARELAAQPGIRVAAGFGPVVADVAGMHRSIRHALMASYWAELATAGDGVAVVPYEKIAHLRLLPTSAMSIAEDLRDLTEQLNAVVSYDLENGTDLARTLDSFLTNSGSVAKSAAELFIHRNTLRQRMQRIEELIGRSPEGFEDWITAGIAVRLIRDSETELSSTAPGRGHRCPVGVMTIGRSCCGVPTHCVVRPGRDRPASANAV